MLRCDHWHYHDIVVRGIRNRAKCTLALSAVKNSIPMVQQRYVVLGINGDRIQSSFHRVTKVV